MYKKPTDKFVSINTEKFSVFLPLDIIQAVLLYKHENTNLGSLVLQPTLPLGGQPMSYIDKDYNSLIPIYNQIMEQIGSNEFIDLFCGGTRLFIREKGIVGISHNLSTATKHAITLYYSPNEPNYNCQSYGLEQSENDIKQDYLDLLAQISYRSRPNKLSENRFWKDWELIGQDKANSSPVKVVYKPISIVNHR